MKRLVKIALTGFTIFFLSCKRPDPSPKIPAPYEVSAVKSDTPNVFVITGIRAKDSSEQSQLMAAGMNAQISGDWEVLLSTADALIELDIRSWDGWFKKGLALNRLGHPGLAVAPLRKALELESDSPRAWEELEFSLLESGDPIEAAKARKIANELRARKP